MNKRFRKDLKTREIRQSLHISVRQVERDIKRLGWIYMLVSARFVQHMVAKILDNFLHGEGTGEPVGIVNAQ